MKGVKRFMNDENFLENNNKDCLCNLMNCMVKCCPKGATGPTGPTGPTAHI